MSLASIFAWSIEAGRQWHFPGAAYTLAALLLVASATIVAKATREGSVA